MVDRFDRVENLDQHYCKRAYQAYIIVDSPTLLSLLFESKSIKPFFCSTFILARVLHIMGLCHMEVLRCRK